MPLASTAPVCVSFLRVSCHIEGYSPTNFYALYARLKLGGIMAPERRLQVERLHQLALQHDSGEREEFLAAQCGGDHELRREVEALLGLSGKGTEPASATATLHFPPGSGKGPIPLTLQRLGKYGLQTEIGRGGFGRVYVAWDPMVDRKVAIKVLIAGDDPDLLVRFRNEASSAGKLHHQNIVTIYDFGEEQGVPFIVMELLDGQNLHQIFAAKTQLALDTKVSIVSQAAAGLHHAHMNGLVHRDVKPGNIMVLPDFSVKLLDFGIARLTQTTSARLTQQGMLIGTANYMSPEQLGQGADSDALSDIFSLGVVAYELLAGRHPFQASSPVAVMFAITSKEPEPLRKYSPDCPAALEDVVMRALAKDRDQRYHSAQDIVLDLEPILRELRQKRASQLVAEAERNLAAEQLESANALLREILDLDPGNTTARRLRDSAQRKLQRRAVKPKIDALLSQGQDFLAGRQFDAARERLDVAFRLDPTDPQIQSLRDRVAAAQAQAKRTDELVEGARKAFHEKNLTGAYQSVAAALQSDPEHPEAGALLQQIRAEIHHQERERALREGLTKARASLKVEAFDEALTLLTALQAQHPDSADLQDLKAEVQQRKAERERREKLLRSLNSARDLLRQRQTVQAIRILEPLAGEFPDNTEVADLLSSARQAEQAEKQAQKVAETERETEKLLAAQDFARAAAVVEAALALYPADATMVRIQDRVHSVKAAAERERAIRNIVAKSEKLLAGEKFVEAANLLDNAVREHGDEAVLVDLRGRVEQAWTAWKRVQARQAAIADARRLLQKGRAAEAVASIQGALTAHPADSELLGLLSSAQKLLADQQRAEAVRRLSLEIEAQLTAGQLDQAQASQQEGLHKYPGEPALEALGSRIAEAQKAAARRRALQNTQDSIQKLLQAGRFAEALEQIEAALQLDSDEELVRLKQEIETQWEREKVRATLAQAREHLDAGRIDESIALLEAAARERTDKVEIKGLLAYARERRKAAETRAAIDRIMIEGAALADAGRLEEALQTVEQGCRQYASEPGLLRLRDMLAERLRIAEQRRLEAERARLEAERQRQEEEARKRREEEARLREEADRKRRAEEDRQAVEVLERAGQLRQERATEAALKLLEEAIARLGHRPALDELQEQIRADQRRALSARQTLDRARAALEQGQINVATQLASYLETELPGEVDTEDLQASIAAKVEQQRVQAAIEAAAQQALILRDQGRFEEALSLLDMELREHPGAQVLESARDRIRSDHQTFLLEQARKEALAEISILPLSARRASDESELQKVVARAEEIAAAYSSDKQFKQAAKAASKAVARRRAEWKKIQTAAEAAPAPRWRRAIAAGVIVGLSLGALIWKLSSSRGATLQVSTNPPGARVTAGKMSCITPNCALDLPPGSYRIQAQKAGYRAASANVEIGKGSRVPVELTLVPLPTRLLVGANFTRGTVTLDGSEAGQLRNGEFVLDSVPEGTHTLNIRSPEGQATLHFEQILSAPSVNQTQAIVVSGSASAAEIRCDCISGEVTVDGKPAGRLEGGRLALPGLAQGTHQFRVTAPDGIRDSVVALQENPSLNLFLTADRDVGTLVVEAGQDDVQVFMDNRPLAALTHDGLVRLTLPVKQYSVRVEKKGYRQPLAKSVEVKKGELARLLFKLAPLDAVLAIREAMPRVRVLIDGQAVGTTGADGTLLVNNITPGDHGIELTRDGYSPRRWNRKFDPGATVNLGRGDVSLAEIQASPLPPPPSPPVKQTPPAPDPRAVEAEEWDRVRNTRNVDQLEEFRHKYPTGANSEQAARRIEQIEWDNLQNTRDPTAFQAFADKYPNGSHADQARRRIEDLEWARVDKQNAGQIRAFLQQHPGSLQAPDASAALAALQQVERLAADRLAINQVLVQYQQAYAAKNLAELLVLRPSLAGSRAEKEIRDAFHASRSIALQLVPIREPEVSEDTAAVQCRETTKETVDKRPLPEHNETVTITLRRSGQTWIIQDIK
jgi:serine/threonine protein kinase/predicted Zn-dependent protease